MKKPQIRIQNQGKIIVEPGEVGLLVMFPDGQIEGAPSMTQATAKARAWFKANVEIGAAGVGTIEWRGDCGSEKGTPNLRFMVFTANT